MNNFLLFSVAEIVFCSRDCKFHIYRAQASNVNEWVPWKTEEHIHHLKREPEKRCLIGRQVPGARSSNDLREAKNKTRIFIYKLLIVIFNYPIFKFYMLKNNVYWPDIANGQWFVILLYLDYVFYFFLKPGGL